MAKYINADPLIKTFRSLQSTSLCNKFFYEVILKILKEQPAADVEPVRRGKWSEKMVAYRAKSDISKHGDMHFGFKCSLCGAVLNKTRYCGNCGARMEGDNNGN